MTRVRNTSSSVQRRSTMPAGSAIHRIDSAYLTSGLACLLCANWPASASAAGAVRKVEQIVGLADRVEVESRCVCLRTELRRQETVLHVDDVLVIKARPRLEAGAL